MGVMSGQIHYYYYVKEFSLYNQTLMLLFGKTLYFNTNTYLFTAFCFFVSYQLIYESVPYQPRREYIPFQNH